MTTGPGPEKPGTHLYRGDASEAPAHLRDWLRSLGSVSPLVLATPSGEALASLIDGRTDTPPSDAGIAWAAARGAEAHRDGTDLIVAVGGGRCLDLGKLAAARAGVSCVSVPTQLSHDGLCSPVAVALDQTGVKRSVGAIAPRAVYLSMPVLLNAPVASVRAGIGDLLANPYALKDWKLAADHGIEKLHDEAWELSERAFVSIHRLLDTDVAALAADPGFLEALADSLILSGIAMIVSGSSRPASGGEHEISHAIDDLFGGRALHGEQVAFGCIVSAALYGDDFENLIDRMGKLGLPSHPGDLGLSLEEMARVIVAAPDTRPGRFTILEDAALDEDGARELVERIWPS